LSFSRPSFSPPNAAGVDPKLVTNRLAIDVNLQI